MRCVECAYLEVSGSMPKCGFLNVIIPSHIYAMDHKKAGPDLRQRVGERLRASEKIVEGSGMCRWALFEFADLSHAERRKAEEGEP